MHAPKTQTRTVQAPPQAAYDALLGIAQQDKPYALIGANNEHHMLVFARGRTPLSWGTLHLVTVAVEGSGSSITVTVAGRDDVPKALLDGWKHGRAGAKLLDRVEAVLAGTESAPHTPVESFLQIDEDRREPWTTAEFPIS